MKMLVAGALVLAGCGSTGLAPGETRRPPDSVSQECADKLAGLTDALFELNSRLSVGIAFAAYGEKVANARVAYDKIKFNDLDPDCILGVGQPAEAAMNEYVNAYTTWNDCIQKTGCNTDSIQPQLQASWLTATATLAAVKGRLP